MATATLEGAFATIYATFSGKFCIDFTGTSGMRDTWEAAPADLYFRMLVVLPTYESLGFCAFSGIDHEPIQTQEMLQVWNS